MMRVRFAPNAVRMAISFRRSTVRASIKLATFAHAINRTHTTAPNSISSGLRTSPTVSSRSGTTAAPVACGISRVLFGDP